MFKFLSKLLPLRVSPADLSTLEKAMSDLYEMIGKMQTNINSIERKVYRDQAEGNGSDPEAVAAAFNPPQAAPDPSNYGPGDQLPPGFLF